VTTVGQSWIHHGLALVLGGTFYGTYPTLALNSNDDEWWPIGDVWIPTTAIDQYGATLAACTACRRIADNCIPEF